MGKNETTLGDISNKHELVPVVYSFDEKTRFIHIARDIIKKIVWLFASFTL
jgi:hypothetical protein